MFRSVSFGVALATTLVLLASSGRARADEARSTTDVAPTDKSSSAVEPRDVVLNGQGQLLGKLLDSQGQPAPDKRVVVWHEREQVAVTSTDENGKFAVPGLRGGVYFIASETGFSVVRIWTKQTAPPSAREMTIVYQRSEVVRGNFLGRPRDYFRKPEFLAAMIGGAIALPIALHDDEAS
ncbi:MAG: carboxypeptidase regulatory-like domain-containing protein [Planctomycetota bacterium]|nr:MAG: carboxypeptidase regulatory-like domain-containing protein [Planctomycetota bacterium]REJ93656.1 MAG: carboxypeptidase regulatory-like domain-containing protein [Planctomycetota bacterium]